MAYSSSSPWPGAGGKKEILVVDDAPSNLRLLLRALSGEGYLVRCAKSTALALRLLQTALPDLVLLDIRMPQSSGYDLCQQLKANSRTQDIPVIFLSVLDKAEDKVRAFELGAVDYIAKPYQIAEVLTRVRYHLQRQEERRRLQIENARLRQAAIDQQQHLGQQEHAHRLLNQVFDSLAEGIAAFRAVRNQQGEIVSFECWLGNAALGDWVGRSPLDLAGATLSEILGDYTDGSDVFEQFIQVVEQHRSLRYELLHEPEGGIPLWFEIMARRLGDGLVASLKDITEYKQVVTQLQATIGELQMLTTQDGLTQVANRRAFDQYLQLEWQRLLRLQAPIALIMGDIDRFKRFNDLCGHAVGDDCLRQVAAAIASVVKRPADMVARYGGEEFAILLPHTDLQGAAQLGEQIQAVLASLRLRAPRVECERVSLSLGVASQVPHRSSSIDDLLAAADAALYRAKALGGNQMCLGGAPAAPAADPQLEWAFDEEE